MRQAVEACFVQRDVRGALNSLHATCSSQLEALTAAVRSPGMAPLLRRVVVALVTTDVHNRDVVGTLAARRCTSAESFDWLKLLRCGGVLVCVLGGMKGMPKHHCAVFVHD